VVAAAVILETMMPAAFWLLAQIHFEDDFRVRPRHAAALLLLLAFGAAPALVPSLRFGAWPLVPRLLALAVVGHALATVRAGGQADLVVSRLRARHTALWIAGAYIFAELLAEAFVGPWIAPRTGAAVHGVSCFLLVSVVCWISLRLDSQMAQTPRPAAEPVAVLDPSLAERLSQLVEVEQVFRQEGLTIVAIANRLGVHEHKVRQLINAHLGFKNFNAFLHHYRLREARLALSDPARAHLGIAQIAYDVGYRSLGPFNKAFKELFGQTPTEFRAAATAGTVSRAPEAS
jgi:AraC-like DNA-binding protein